MKVSKQISKTKQNKNIINREDKSKSERWSGTRKRASLKALSWKAKKLREVIWQAEKLVWEGKSYEVKDWYIIKT